MKQFNLRLWIIQNIRFAQAVMEVDEDVGVPKKFEDILVHINKFYKSPYKICKDTDELMDCKYSHKKPFIEIGSVHLPLVFPMCMINHLRKQWNHSERKFVFKGFMWEKREELFSNWTGKPNIEITATTNGREFPSKSWDEDYYKVLLNNQFALCPDGGYTWTYRFFESIICGAIPVIAHSVKEYDGFFYYKLTDKPEDMIYSEEVAVQNLELLKLRCTFLNKGEENV